jgi:multidrug efflux pump subunit AcrA (membrane-fusion protein)
MKSLILTGMAGLAVMGGAGAKWAALASQPTAVVAPGTIEERIVARALVVPAGGTARVRSRVEGRVGRVLVREGDRVRAGDLLAEIGGERLEADVKRCEAELDAATWSARAVGEGARPEERAAAEADLRAADHELKLAEARVAVNAELEASGGGVPRQEKEQAEEQLEVARARRANAAARLELARAGGRPSEVRAAEARVAAARAELAAAEDARAGARLTAPSDGVVLERRVDPGDTVGPGDAGIFAIADPGRLEARIEVDERDAARIAPGQRVEIRAEGGREVVAEGELARVAARLEPRTIGARDARVRADSSVRVAWIALAARPSGPGFVLGERLEATIVPSRAAVEALVPRSAVCVRDAHAVLEVPWGPFASEVEVTMGRSDGSFVEVRDIPVGTTVLLH